MSDPTPDPETVSPRFERWAARLFAVLIFVTGLAAVVVLANSGDTPPGAILLGLGTWPLGVTVLLAAMWGLGASRPWARPLALGVLWILVFAGVVQFIASLSSGIKFPLEAIAAAFVLRTAGDSPRRLLMTARDQRIAVALTGLFLVSTAWPLVSSVALRPGASPFAVGSDALDVTVAIDCSGATGEDGIRATITWRWGDRDLFPGSTDGLFVGWSTIQDLEAPYYDQEASSWPPGVWPGLGSPAAMLIQPMENGWQGQSTTFGIDVARAGQGDGEVVVVLRPNSEGSHGSVTVNAAYAHLDRWVRDSDGAGCGW